MIQNAATYEKSVELAVERARNNQFIHNQFESTNVAFFGKVTLVESDLGSSGCRF